MARNSLAQLSITGDPVTDLTPLRGMNLSEIMLTPSNIKQGISELRKMTNLKVIGTSQEEKDHFSPAEFWRKYDAGEFNK